IGGVLATEPEVYVLDGASAGLDPKGQQGMMDMFYEIHEQEQARMILVTHSMADALEYADNIMILNNGEQFVAGTPEDSSQQQESIRSVQLQVPETIQFIKKFNAKMGTNLPLKRQTVTELAAHIKATLGENNG